MTIEDMSKSLQQTKDNIGKRDTTRNILLKRNSEKVLIEENTTVIKTDTIGHSFILGHSVNGVLGTANGVDGSPVVLGESGRTETIVRINNPNNTYREHFRDDTFEDSVNTTADLNTTHLDANHTVDLGEWGVLLTLS